MALWIQNISSDDHDPTEPDYYRVAVNNESALAHFRHCRTDGAAQCLRDAADAIDDLTPKPSRVTRTETPFYLSEEFDPNNPPGTDEEDIDDEDLAHTQVILGRGDADTYSIFVQHRTDVNTEFENTSSQEMKFTREEMRCIQRMLTGLPL